MYHATMPTDALVQVKAALFATRDFGFEKVRETGQAKALSVLQFSTVSRVLRRFAPAVFVFKSKSARKIGRFDTNRVKLLFFFRRNGLRRTSASKFEKCWKKRVLSALLLLDSRW